MRLHFQCNIIIVSGVEDLSALKKLSNKLFVEGSKSSKEKKINMRKSFRKYFYAYDADAGENC